MAKDEIDDLLAAIAAVDLLQDFAAKQSRLIVGILDELDRLRARVSAIETGSETLPT